MILLRLSSIAVGLLALLFCSSCAQVDKVLQTGKHQTEKIRSAFAGGGSTYWNDKNPRGAGKIVVSLREQRAYFYRGKRLVGESNISTGRKGFETPPGNYRVIQKDADHYSNLYGEYVDENGRVVKPNVDIKKDPKPPGAKFVGASMPYFLRFTGGYGMHAGYVPRYRASHGCIRMPSRMARRFFDAADLGTAVIVKE